MLRKWQQKQGENATYKQLREVFEQCERADLVKVVKQLVAGLSEESERLLSILYASLYV